MRQALREEPPLLKGFVAVELIAVLALGIFTITNFQIWAPVDERGHFDYVETVADQHRLPTLDRHLPLGRSYGAHTYEAFQPPAYYVVAAPLLTMTHDHHTRILILRSFGLVLLLLTIFVFWHLVLTVFPARPLLPFAFGMTFFLIPGVVVRSVTISYQPLGTLLAVVGLLVLVKAYRAPKGGADGWLLASAAAVALAVMTHVLLAYLAGVFVVVGLRRLWVERDRRRTLLFLVSCASIAIALVGPWLAFNRTHYGSLTGNFVARDIQQPLINPTHQEYTLGDVPHITSEYMKDYYLPNEWINLTVVNPAVKPTGWLLSAVLFAVPLVLFLIRPGATELDIVLVLGLPFVLSYALAVGASTNADWPSAGRYLYGAGAPWMLFAYAAVSNFVRSRWLAIGILAVAIGGVAYLWAEGLVRYF
ncbi:MAG: hypothetical protein JO248_07670 [Acidimicrobiia bacterium]|nr:hypothetical protein [Acidimicrobiia bacterium]